jgi:hypothetical protein
MPNWCENILTVEGAPDEVQKFRNENTFVEVGEQYHMAAGETRVLPLSFEALSPTPRNPDGTLIAGPAGAGMPDWYDWRIKNWGTKWDLSDQTQVSTTPGHIEYRFDTAWSPPVEWLAHVADVYPKLSFDLYYREDGMCFEGVAEASGGSITRDDTWEMDVDSEEEVS